MMASECRWCGKPVYSHLGVCPRIKSITISGDGSETVELRGPPHTGIQEMIDRDVLNEIADSLRRILAKLDQLPDLRRT